MIASVESLERREVVDRHLAGAAHGDRLQPLRPHHRADAAAPGLAAVVVADAGERHAVLAGRADRRRSRSPRRGPSLSIFSASMVPLPQYFVASRSSTRSSSMNEVDRARARCPRRRSGRSRRTSARGRSGRRPSSRRAPLESGLTAPKQHLLPDGAKLPEITPGSHHQPVLGPERVGVARHLVVEDLGDEAAAAEPGAGERRDRAVCGRSCRCDRSMRSWLPPKPSIMAASPTPTRTSAPVLHTSVQLQQKSHLNGRARPRRSS